jgi:RNA polymerase sigma factor (sigma-70 family)
LIKENELILARRIGYRVGSRWSFVDVEDVTSELTLWLFANAETVRRYRTEEGGEGKLFVALKRVASRYAVREQEARSGGPIETDSPYTEAQIERALPFIFERPPETTVTDLSGRVVGSMPSQFGRGHDVILDVRNAFQVLSPEQRTAVILRFRDGMSYKEVAALIGITESGVKKRVRRSIARMNWTLGGGGPDAGSV